MAGGRVGVLADDQHSYVAEWTLQAPQHIFGRGQIVAPGRRFAGQEGVHRLELIGDRRQGGRPVSVDSAAFQQSGSTDHGASARDPAEPWRRFGLDPIAGELLAATFLAAAFLAGAFLGALFLAGAFFEVVFLAGASAADH